MRPGEDAVSRLQAVGLAPADIGHVALSHLHIDHAGGVAFFPDAVFYAQRRELEFGYRPPVYQRRFYIREDFDHPVSWRQLEGECDLFGDGRVVLFPTPGHSAGHQSMLVNLDGGAIILVADAAYSSHNLEQRALPAILWNPDVMVQSWERLEALRDRHRARLLFTHDLQWRSNTRLGPEQWYE